MGTEPKIVEGGDWTTISSTELLFRVDPYEAELKEEEESESLVRTLETDGVIYGRASISRDESFWSQKGWVTVAGLRATATKNIEGVLIGEAVTADRNFALPSVPLSTLSEWATEQGELISKTRWSDIRKNRAAEIVLECGGSISDLPIAQWGGEWINTDEFLDRISSLDEIMVSFSGEFSYEENDDDMHPREFRDNFVVSDDVITVEKIDGSIVRAGGAKWPGNLTRPDVEGSNLENYVLDILSETWGDVEFESDLRVVGSAAGHNVWRSVSIFRKTDSEDAAA